MTTKRYIVAYPNSLVCRLRCTCEVQVDSLTRINGLLSQLRELYPNHTEDLKYASIYKVSCRLSIA